MYPYLELLIITVVRNAPSTHTYYKSAWGHKWLTNLSEDKLLEKSDDESEQEEDHNGINQIITAIKTQRNNDSYETVSYFCESRPEIVPTPTAAAAM